MTKEEIMTEARHRLDSGEDPGNWVELVFSLKKGAVEMGISLPPQTEMVLGQRRYSLWDLAQGYFKE